MRKLLLLLLLAAPPAATGTPAWAADDLKLDLTFAIYASGLHLVTLDASTVIASDRYTMRTRMRTEGMADWLTRFTQQGESSGTLKGDAPSPVRFLTASDGRFGKRVAELVWDEAGQVRTVRLEPPVDAEDRTPILPEMLPDAVDPGTANMLRALTGTTREACSGVSKIFDGRRRYNLHFTAAGEVNLAPSSYTAYAGPALKCAVRFEAVGGYVRKEMDNTKVAEGRAISVWLAEGVDKRMHIPVRLEVESGWGPLIIHLTRAVIDGQVKLQKVAN